MADQPDAGADADREPIVRPVGLARGPEVAGVTAVVLALGLAVASGPGLVRLVLSVGAVVGLVRLHVLLDLHPPGGSGHPSGSTSEGTR